jgi:NTP pyrophosphatase (non-canonical NTP hydrolase)
MSFPLPAMGYKIYIMPRFQGKPRFVPPNPPMDPHRKMQNSIQRTLRIIGEKPDILRRFWDWRSKVDEELGEVDAEIQAPQPSLARITDEMGDVFQCLFELAIQLGVDPEAAIRGASDKLVRRHNHMQQHCPLPFDKLTHDQANDYWQQAKKEVG